MVEHQSFIEAHFRDLIEEALISRYNVGLNGLRFDEETHVLHVDFAFPAATDRALRHRVLAFLTEFEDDSAEPVETSPTFTWDDEEADE